MIAGRPVDLGLSPNKFVATPLLEFGGRCPSPLLSIILSHGGLAKVGFRQAGNSQCGCKRGGREIGCGGGEGQVVSPESP